MRERGIKILWIIAILALVLSLISIYFLVIKDEVNLQPPRALARPGFPSSGAYKDIFCLDGSSDYITCYQNEIATCGCDYSRGDHHAAYCLCLSPVQ